MSDEQNVQDGSQPIDVNETVNKAVTAQLKREMKKFEDSFKAALQEQFAALTKQSTQQPSSKEDPKPSEKMSPEMAAMQTRLDDMRKQLDLQQSRAESAEKKAREDRAFNDLRSALSPHVRPDMLDLAARDLFISQRRVEFDADGTPLFKTKRSIGPGLGDEEVQLPLSDGVAQFLKSKEAAPFLPAPGGQSNPNSRGGTRMPTDRPTGLHPNGLPKYDKPASTPEEKVRRAYEREQAIAQMQAKQNQ